MTTLGFVCLLVALGTALWSRWRSGKVPVLLVLLLVLALGAETTAVFFASDDRGNQWVYNLYMLLESAVLMSLVGAVGRSVLLARMALGCLVAIGLMWMWEVELEEGLYVWANNTFVLAALFHIVIYTTALLSLADSLLTPLWLSPEFWLSLSVVVFFGSMIPYNGVLNHLWRTDRTLAMNLYSINEVLACVRYGLVTLACVRYARNGS